jgi:hypothetical protein
MTYEAIALWEIIIDAVGLILCLAALARVVRCRNRALTTPSRPGAAGGRGAAFSAEIRLQMLEQKAEAALAALSVATVGAGEHRAPGGPGAVSIRPGGDPLPETAPLSRSEAEDPVGEPATAIDPYDEIIRLAGSGLDVDAIYSRLKISKGEIRLALQLHEFCPPAAREMRVTA